MITARMYRFLFTIVFFGKRKNNTHKTFNIFKMKAYFEKEPHFENESSYRNPFWKWKHVLGKVYQGSVDDHGKNEDQDQKYHQNNDCSSSGYSLVPKKIK